ncbi:hypothetical protein MRY87_10185 [bacterium]|nr:hypothetical protein [bacterium]
MRERFRLLPSKEEREEKDASRRCAGANLVEYSLLALLIAVACIIGVQVLGEQVSVRFSTIASGFQDS